MIYPTLFAFACTVKGKDWHTIVHAEKRGQAKSLYLSDVKDTCPDTKYTDIRCKKAWAYDNGQAFPTRSKMQRYS